MKCWPNRVPYLQKEMDGVASHEGVALKKPNLVLPQQRQHRSYGIIIIVSWAPASTGHLAGMASVLYLTVVPWLGLLGSLLLLRDDYGFLKSTIIDAVMCRRFEQGGGVAPFECFAMHGLRHDTVLSTNV